MLITISLHGQFSFQDLGLTGVANGTVAWGDYDGDGDLDILSTGSPTFTSGSTKIYRNEGNGSFTAITHNLLNIRNGMCSRCDYDLDGDLDILLTGSDWYGQIAKIYRNNGNESWTNINDELRGVYYSSVDWGDYDNDGDPDLLITGSYAINGTAYRITRIYRNDGNDIFVDIQAQLPAIYMSAGIWGDYDNDGDLDILLSGYRVPDRITRIYRNDGEDVFVDIEAGLPGLSYSIAAWGDYDLDGDLDLFIAGSQTNYSSSKISRIYRNDGEGVFVDIGANLTGMDRGSAQWGDYDNNGDPDLLLCGLGGNYSHSILYHNDGNDTFTDAGAGLIPAGNSSAAWGDYDNDNDLDLLITGSPTTATFSARLYRNDTALPNSQPSPPQGLNTVIGRDRLLFEWDAALDEESPATGMSYNLRIGITPDGSELCSGMALTNGYRLLSARGSIGSSCFWPMKLVRFAPETTYYWSVQAIDTALSGSAWSAPVSFQIPNYPLAPQNLTIIMNGGDALISWDPVTHTVFGTPITPDRYYIWGSETPDENALFTLLDRASGTSYLHSGDTANRRFYKVTAVKVDQDTK